MGIEYEELRVQMKNKNTGEIIELSKQIPHKIRHPVGFKGKLYEWETDDFEYLKHQVVYG